MRGSWLYQPPASAAAAAAAAAAATAAAATAAAAVAMCLFDLRNPPELQMRVYPILKTAHNNTAHHSLNPLVTEA